MRKIKTYPSLSSKYILEHVNQEDIFSVYFGIPISQILAIVGTNKKISAPYRTDSDPSMGFTYRSNGKLICRDFGGYFWGDCFDCVGFVLNLNPFIKSDFGKILEHIARTFNIGKFANSNTNFDYKKISIQIKEKPTLNIQITQRKWNIDDAEFWYKRYGVNREILKHYKVYPINYLYFNGNCVYMYDYRDPAYAYYLGRKDRIDYWKIYYPFRKKGQKFHSNGAIVQGISQITPSDFGVITKSLKDVMCLASLLVQAVAPASETGIMTTPQINYIKSKWKFVVSLMDFDDTGRKIARQLRREFNIPSLFITNGDFGTFNFGKKVKDISDYHAKYGRKQTLLLKNNIIENDFDFTNDFLNFITQQKHY